MRTRCCARRMAATVLRTAHARLAEVRREQPNAGGLATAKQSQDAPRPCASLAPDALRSDGARRDVGRPSGVRGIAGCGVRPPGLVRRAHTSSEGVDIPHLVGTSTRRRLRPSLLPAGGWPLRALEREAGRAGACVAPSPTSRACVSMPPGSPSSAGAHLRRGGTVEPERNEARERDRPQTSKYHSSLPCRCGRRRAFRVSTTSGHDELDDGDDEQPGRVRAELAPRRRSGGGDTAAGPHAARGEAPPGARERDRGARARPARRAHARAGQRRAEPALPASARSPRATVDAARAPARGAEQVARQDLETHAVRSRLPEAVTAGSGLTLWSRPLVSGHGGPVSASRPLSCAQRLASVRFATLSLR